MSQPADVNGSSAARQAVPLLGTPSDWREAALGGCLAAFVTGAYTAVAAGFGTSTTTIEIISLWASLACVWLARTENIWTMPYGILAVVLLGWFLLDIGLVGQGWLQYVYYVPVQLAGWWAWARGGTGRTELPITKLSGIGWSATLALAIAGWFGLWWLFGSIYDESVYLGWDTSIVASSVTAQTLMTLKKRESWWFWTIPVNVSSIGLFVVTDTWAFVFLYVIFLGNSLWGAWIWARRSST